MTEDEAKQQAHNSGVNIWAKNSRRHELHPNSPAIIWRRPHPKENLPPGTGTEIFPSWVALLFYLKGWAKMDADGTAASIRKALNY